MWISVLKALPEIHTTISLMWKQMLTCLAASICSPDRELKVLADWGKLSENGENWVFYSSWDGICSLITMWLQSMKNNLSPFPLWSFRTYTSPFMPPAVSTLHFDGELYFIRPQWHPFPLQYLVNTAFHLFFQFSLLLKVNLFTQGNAKWNVQI